MKAAEQNHCNLVDFLALTDEQLLRQCRLEVFRGSGPGGQKRNKTSSAVRLVHIPSGITASAGERRSQPQNRTAALARLRHRIALDIRRPFVPRKENLDISMSRDRYPVEISWTLDALEETAWSISDAAKRIGVTTGRLSAFLRRDALLWAFVNQQRKRAGLKGLV